MGDKGDEKYRYKKKGPVKAYPIKQLLENSSQFSGPGGMCDNSPVLYSRVVPEGSSAPAPVHRTKSNESFSSKNSPNSSRGVSPVQSYLQSQWPRDIRQSLINNKNDIECQTESLVDKNEENSCENCVGVKSLTDSGVALNELKRIRRRASPNPCPQVVNLPQGVNFEPSASGLFASGDAKILPLRLGRPPSVDGLQDELTLLNSDNEDFGRYVCTPLDGRRPPRPTSVDSQTQTDHICEKPTDFPKYRSPCQSPGRSIRQHPPSPGTNKSYLFKREPPDGAEVIKPICDSNKPVIDSDFQAAVDCSSNVENTMQNKSPFVRPKNTFKPSPNSNFVYYKPQKNKFTDNRC